MNKHDFTALVKNPNNLGALETEKLREVVQAYPYFAVARNLLVKSLHKTSHYEYENALKMAALLTGNRAVLYNLVHDLPLNSDVIGKEEEFVETLDLSSPATRGSTESVQTENIIAEVEEVKVEEIKQEALKIEEPKIEEPKAAEPKVERFISEAETVKENEPKVIEQQPLNIEFTEEPPKPRFTNEITEEEKLVKPEGRFKKYIPNKTVKDTSSASIISDKDEEILSDFDISSLDHVGSWQVVKPVVTAEPKAIEPPKEEVAPLPAEELVIAPQEEVAKVEEALVEPEPEKEQEEDFLTWLKNKEAKNEVKPQAPKVEEDEVFVVSFTESLAVSSQETLSAEIHEQVFAITEVEANKEVPVNEELPKEPASPAKAEEILEPVVEKEFEFNFDFLPKKEVLPEPVKEVDLLSSLEAYEIDIFMAPVYKGASFDAQIFDAQFNEVYETIDGASGLEDIDEEETFLIEEPLPSVEVDFSKAPFIPFTEINAPAPPPAAPPVQTDNYPSLAIPPAAPPPAAPPPHAPKNTVESILDKFIRENPTIARPKSEFYSPINMAKQSVEADEELVSETLATIYLGQGLHKKAILMYEKLGLLYPDKLAYFAGLIEKVKSENNLN